MKKLFALVIASAMVASAACASDLVPASSGSQSLGQSLLQWLNGYFINVYTTNLTVSGSGTFANSGNQTVGGTLLVTGASTFSSTASVGSTLNLGTNAYLYAGQFPDRASLVTNLVTTNMPVGSVVLSGTGKAYLRVAGTATTQAWFTVTSDNVE